MYCSTITPQTTKALKIINQLELDPDTAIVWGGDFNLIFDASLDADGGKPQLKVNSLSKLLSITEENDLCDIFRVRYPNEKRFTWRRKNPLKQRRLDYFFVFDTLQDTVERIEIIPSVQSDHSTLCLKFYPKNERNREIPIGNSTTLLFMIRTL